MLLEIDGLKKAFGKLVVLSDVEFSLAAGEVHALLGENGAGKSTLINIIAGIFPATEGTVRVKGQSVTGMDPKRARALGISAVFQEFSLAPDLSVLDNIFLGNEYRRGPFLSSGRMRREALCRMEELGFHLPLDVSVSQLSRAQKQMVEIVKALRTGPDVLILDEPTASLTDGEAEKLFAAIDVLKKRGVGIIYVSHRMSEIRALSDRVTVLRGGRHIGTVRTADTTDGDLIEMMVGRPVDQLFPEIHANPGEVRLELRDLSTDDGTVQGASLTAHAGEVVGLAGLVGCGRRELMRAIFGLQPIGAGELLLHGTPVPRPTPKSMLARGLCYFPGDRAAEGLALVRPARENASMASLDREVLSAGPVLKYWRETAAIRRPLEDLGLRPMAPEQRMLSFSGGNQQKVMLARGLMNPFDIYLFDEPTVGIDVGAKADVYGLIKTLVEGGACVILSTSELPELVHLAHRVYVMHDGRIVREVADQPMTEAAVLSDFFGA